MDFSSFADHKPFTARLTIAADLDPQLPGRVLDRFAERGELPLRFSSQVDASEALRIEVEFDAATACARLLARRLQNLPTVRSVALTFHHKLMTPHEKSEVALSA